ncbi:MAG: hypothetical protein IKA87_08310 [Lentisphaeria bacterium]|nr:hypothetical protein [Lentisphaeria bacterium]
MMYNILDYGAVPDGKVLNTQAIQDAVDACHAAGGGTVVVPPGKFITGTVFLKSRVHLHLESGALLQGSPNMDDYCSDDAYEQNAKANREGWRGAHLIAAVEAEDVMLSGPGIIDGNCDAFFIPPGTTIDAKWAGGLAWARGIRVNDSSKIDYRPGQMVVFVQCRRVQVENITLRNSTCWTLFLHGTRQAVIKGVIIDNPVDGINTDGIDIDCSSQVTVSDCIITVGDDAITLRASGARLKDHPPVCEDITVTNCVLDSSVCAFRLGVGAGVIRNAVISNIVIRFAGLGFLLQPSYGRNGAGVRIENISASNIRARQLGHPVRIIAGAEDVGDGAVRNIDFSNFRCECAGNIEIAGNQMMHPQRISFRDCAFDVVNRPCFCREDKCPDTFFLISLADNILFKDCELNWLSPDPEWKFLEKISQVDGLEKINCSFPELKK